MARGFTMADVFATAQSLWPPKHDATDGDRRTIAISPECFELLMASKDPAGPDAPRKRALIAQWRREARGF